MKVYLDVRCLSRLTDDQSQARIREEAEAMEQILELVEKGALRWISSEALMDEVMRNPIPDRRADNEALLALATETIQLNERIIRRARQLAASGFGSYDALHLASAESAAVDVLLSTDDRLLRRASRGEGVLRIAVANPLVWLKEQGP